MNKDVFQMKSLSSRICCRRMMTRVHNKMNVVTVDQCEVTPSTSDFRDFGYQTLGQEKNRIQNTQNDHIKEKMNICKNIVGQQDALIKPKYATVTQSEKTEGIVYRNENQTDVLMQNKGTGDKDAETIVYTCEISVVQPGACEHGEEQQE